MPKGVRRNPFQALLDTANKQLQFAKERLSAAEHHADCIHQKKLRAARHEHDEWAKMVRSLNTSLTIPQPRQAVEIPTELIEDTPPLPPVSTPVRRTSYADRDKPVDPASMKQSNNDARREVTSGTSYAGRGEREGEYHGPNGQPDPGDRLVKKGPQLTGKKPGRQARVDHFDKCPGLPNLQCKNSKPTDSELCGRCATMRSIPPILRPSAV